MKNIDVLETNFIPPDGPMDADILFLGEAPKNEENYRGIPFVGAAGQLLDRCLRGVGIARSEVLVWNIFHKQPPMNNVNYYYTDKTMTVLTEEGEAHIEKLRHWLFMLQKNKREMGIGPNIIVALGDLPLRHLTGKKGITKYRGSILNCTLVPGYLVYATFHPSFVNKLINEPEEVLLGEKKKDAQNVLPLFMKDLERINYIAKNGYTRPERKYKILTNLEEITERFKEIQDKANTVSIVHGKKGRITSGGVMLAIDIETLPTNNAPALWCIGFSSHPSEAFTIPFLKEQMFVWSIQQEAFIINEISKILLHPNIVKIFHSHYDMVVLGKLYNLRCAEGTYEDTMVAHQMNYPYLRKNLALCTSFYTWEPYYKDEGKTAMTGRNDVQEFIYNCKDCAVTREICSIIRKESFEIGTDTNYELSMYIMPSLIEMEIRGVKLDLERKDVLSKKFHQLAEDHEQKLKILAEERELNVNSPAQINKLLYVKLGCKPQYNKKSGKLTSDRDAINKLLKYHHNPGDPTYQILKNLIEFRKFGKLRDTYTSLTTDEEGRIRTSYNFVSTFRLSSSESSLGGGQNLQNIPVRSEEGKEVRRLFIADEGMTLIAGDLAGAEAREVAWLAGDERLINLFLEGWDVHWEKTKRIFNFFPELEYEKDTPIVDIFTGEAHTMKFYRDLGKTIVHAGNYGMGKEMLQTILIRQGVWLELTICEKLLKADKAANPLTVKWQNNTRDEITATRTLTTSLGDVRVFRGRLNDNLFRSAIAFRPQSTVGRLLQIATQRITDEFSPQVQILMNVHDEIIFQVKDDLVDEIIPKVKKIMEIPHMVNGRELIIPVDFKIGKNWGDMKEYII